MELRDDNEDVIDSVSLWGVESDCDEHINSIINELIEEIKPDYKPDHKQAA